MERVYLTNQEVKKYSYNHDAVILLYSIPVSFGPPPPSSINIKTHTHNRYIQKKRPHIQYISLIKGLVIGFPQRLLAISPG
jgi:hypothetical protein